MKHLAIVALMCMTSVLAWAVPARPGTTVTHSQTDGTEITLQLVGDEFMHYYVDQATGLAMELDAAGNYVAIPPSVLSARRANAAKQRSAVNAERMNKLPGNKSAAGPKRVGAVNPLFGTKKVLVILVNFTDVQFSIPVDDFKARYIADEYTEGGHIASVKGYFQAQSYGNFNLDIDVVGPVTVSQPMAYYGGNDSGGNDLHPQQMVAEAVELADPLVNYADYDWNGDHWVDLVFVVYAGYAEAQGAAAETIWPHQWALNYGYKVLDGVGVNSYACTAELTGSTGTVMDGIGTFCHEFSHCLGYPDLYDVDYGTNGSGEGMGSYDLMSSGNYNGPTAHGEVPCGYSAYERWMAGWLTPRVLRGPTDVTDLSPVDDEPQACVIYNPENENEYLIVENRQSKGFFQYWQKYPMSSGLLISHVNYDTNLWANNAINKVGNDQHFTYIPADKSYNIIYIEDFQGDYFQPGDALTTGSHAAVYGAWRTGTPEFTNMDITDITMDDGKVSFKFAGGTIELQHGEDYTRTENAANASVKYVRTLAHTNWQGLYLPFDVQYDEWKDLGTVAVLDAVSGTADEPVLEWRVIESGTLEAHTPCVFQPAQAGEMVLSADETTIYAVPAVDGSISRSDITVTGIYKKKTDMATSHSYGLINGVFRPTNDDSKTLNPYLIFLTFDSPSSAPARVSNYIHNTDGSTTVIEDIDLSPVTDGVYYDLMGRKAENPANGLYIVNGKKVIINK